MIFILLASTVVLTALFLRTSAVASSVPRLPSTGQLFLLASDPGEGRYALTAEVDARNPTSLALSLAGCDLRSPDVLLVVSSALRLTSIVRLDGQLSEEELLTGKRVELLPLRHPTRPDLSYVKVRLPRLPTLPGAGVEAGDCLDETDFGLEQAAFRLSLATPLTAGDGRPRFSFAAPVLGDAGRQLFSAEVVGGSATALLRPPPTQRVRLRLSGVPNEVIDESLRPEPETPYVWESDGRSQLQVQGRFVDLQRQQRRQQEATALSLLLGVVLSVAVTAIYDRALGIRRLRQAPVRPLPPE